MFKVSPSCGHDVQMTVLMEQPALMTVTNDLTCTDDCYSQTVKASTLHSKGYCFDSWLFYTTTLTFKLLHTFA